jgi:hypothetical protein
MHYIASGTTPDAYYERLSRAALTQPRLPTIKLIENPLLRRSASRENSLKSCRAHYRIGQLRNAACQFVCQLVTT